MSVFAMKNNKLYCEDMAVEDLARVEGTPLYIYSKKSFLDNFTELDSAFKDVPHLICYSVKSNSNMYILKLLASAGAGFDIVSGGELFRIVRSVGNASNVVFAGVGKTEKEIIYALNNGIKMFTVESEQELERINSLAEHMKVRARVAIRVNPNVDPKTHRYISTGKKENKFGLDIERAKAAYDWAMMLTAIDPVGIQMHIGSQILTPEPYAQALDKMVPLVNELKANDIPLEYLDIGGGIGIVYKDEVPMTPAEFAAVVVPKVKNLGLTLIIEPGRYIAGNSGILATKVEYVKRSGDKTFVIVDAAMNDLMRPSLYQAYHEIKLVNKHNGRKTSSVDIVGPVCESGDFFAADRELPVPAEGEYLALMSAGAYGFSMSSNYNSRVRPAEVLVSNSSYQVIRRRETWEDLIKQESLHNKEYML
ncbi:MAG: diaminopimelate decarboxylase [Candidatus Auribacter fodinae]|jgi:diaminopimelate decarboxylase|uniref:Diaminopimelate decarboxylase n=1 Tax=Candidatus Auribacter fodinae TaxID=2093366 RepID=A0A3A4RES5_9BACT|nr:MAG: diaminopimelate decarboxylase [Candidatus Auribacter fodinae]